MNGIAISIIAGQLGKVIGVEIASGGVFRTLGNLAKQITNLHWTTAAVGLALLALLLVLKRFAPKVPGPLVAAVVSIFAVYLFSLNASGVRIIGTIPSGLPAPHIPSVVVADLGPLALGAVTIMLVSFCSMMTTARGFATRNGYRIDPNRDLMALGICDLASGLTRGFVVSGADSRTAVADSAGGKTQMTSVVTSNRDRVGAATGVRLLRIRESILNRVADELRRGFHLHLVEYSRTIGADGRHA